MRKTVLAAKDYCNNPVERTAFSLESIGTIVHRRSEKTNRNIKNKTKLFLNTSIRTGLVMVMKQQFLKKKVKSRRNVQCQLLIFLNRRGW